MAQAVAKYRIWRASWDFLRATKQRQMESLFFALGILDQGFKVAAYFEKDNEVVIADRTAICLSVTPKIADSNRNPVTGAQPKVQDLRHLM